MNVLFFSCIKTNHGFLPFCPALPKEHVTSTVNAQLCQKNMLLLQSMRKLDIESTLLQKEQDMPLSNFMFFNHSL